MGIAISRRAREFIQRKGGAVTVRLSPRHGCCGGMASLAVADAVAPDDPSRYRRIEQDGLTLFIAPELADEGLIVDLEGWGIFRHLYVDGAPLSR
ncbi:CC/Se motif family (seleno)protein [Halomonas mongoliensis]|uniref:CC/Se motif family (Seleno)protein n=1 Tax=Halomonas mongoliensis TaxID=321265 RepID=A0ABU1GK27_9GAMM|nr:CC/Se motif family (seleno)protein [Halomonas mongoliensis]MDR5891823.1 CC/Se motif family (seleno)protein [Halomonas mongoliensis]